MNTAPELGHALDSAVIQSGLKELNKDFAFDVVVNRPGDWENVVQFRDHAALEAVRKNRLPVLIGDRYICGLDRGIVPEFKQWTVKQQIMEVPWADADKDDVSIQWVTVPPHYEGYEDLYRIAAKRLDPSYSIMPGGMLVRRRCMGYVKVRGSIVSLGWRHTFERIIHENIPGATRQAIGQKFGVDMNKFPVGAPEELIAALVEE